MEAFESYVCPGILEKNLAKILLGLALLLCTRDAAFAQIAAGKFNDLILEQVGWMPRGGQYSVSRAAT